MFWSLVDREESRLNNERLAADGHADLIEHDKTKTVVLAKQIEAAAKGPLVVVSFRVRTLPSFSDGGALGTFRARSRERRRCST